MPDRILYIQTPSIPKTPVGIENYIVTISQNNGTYSSDKTLAEIQSAAGRGAIIEANTPQGKAFFRTSSGNAVFYVISGEMLYTYTISALAVTCGARMVGTHVITYDTNTHTANMTSTEVYNAIQANDQTNFIFRYGNNDYFLADYQSSRTIFINVSEAGQYFYILELNSIGQITVTTKENITVDNINMQLDDYINSIVNIVRITDTTNRTCASPNNIYRYLNGLIRAKDAYNILVDSNSLPISALTFNDFDTDTRHMQAFGISQDNILYQVSLDPNTDENTSDDLPVVGTYTTLDLNKYFPVTLTTSSGITTSNKTYSQIGTAIENGKIVSIKADGVEGWIGNVGVSSIIVYAMNGTTLYSYLIDSQGITKTSTNLYVKPSGGIPGTDLASTYAGSATNGGAASKTVAIPFGSVDSTSTATAFTVQIPEITSLYDGVCMYVTNGVITSASGYTLKLNNFDALPVYSTLSAASRTTTIFNVAYTMLFVYNSSRVSGGCWDIFYGYDSNTNTIGYQLRTNSSTMPVSGVTYRYRLLFTSADGTKYVPANTSTYTNATTTRAVNQTKINPYGPIRYYGSTATLAVDARPSATILWQQNTCTLGYSFNRTNAALTLTSYKPVYIKCDPQTDGSAIIDSTTPYTQDLPTTADGKIYIFLGIAYSATNIELTAEHPVYCYKDGMIQKWTGLQNIVDLKAPVASPSFTGIPTAPTPTLTENSNQIATTEWVKSVLGNISGAMHFKGTALQTLTDGGTQNAASNVSGSTYLGDAGDVYLQYNDNTKEYVWTGSVWEELGNEDKDIILLHATPTGNTLNNNIIFSIDGISSYSDFLNLYQSKILYITAGSYSSYTKMQILEKNNDLSDIYTATFGDNLYAYDLNCLPRFDINGGHSFQFNIMVISNSGTGIFLTQDNYFIPALAGNGYSIDGVTKQLILDNASTSTPGIVSLGTNSSQAAKGNHTHGNISNTGTMSVTASVSPGDKIVIGQNSTGTLILGPEFSTITSNFLNQAGSFAPLPTASTSNAGIVQLGTSSTTAATGNHAHGAITTDGKVTTTVTIATSDRLLITDSSDSSKVKASGISFGSSTTYFLNNKGEWTIPADTKVTQAAAITTDGNYPILLGNTTATTAITDTVNKASTLVYNPSTKKLLINSATVATVADIPIWTVS